MKIIHNLLKFVTALAKVDHFQTGKICGLERAKLLIEKEISKTKNAK